MSEKFNVYNMVSERIIALLDKGVIPWVRPWSGSALAVSRSTGKPYSLLNQLLLSPDFDGSIESLNTGEFATFKQIQAEGGKVNKGATAHKVVFWRWLRVEEKDDSGNVTSVKDIPFLRYYQVFNIKDTTLAPKHSIDENHKQAEPDEEAEKILNNYWTREGITVHNKEVSHRAFYRPATDEIVLPSIEQYAETAEYYSTAFHESVHSTGHKSRLNRIKDVAAFGGDGYSKEELVAEIGAAALTSIVGLETASSFRNSAAYIQSWRNAIAKDNKLIVTATGKAEKAVEYILNPKCAVSA